MPPSNYPILMSSDAFDLTNYNAKQYKFGNSEIEPKKAVQAILHKIQCDNTIVYVSLY